MKKILVVIWSLLLILALTGCNKNTKNNDSNTSDISQVTNTNSVDSEENKSDNINENFSSDSTQPNNNTDNNDKNQLKQDNPSKSNTETSSKGTVANNNNASNGNTETSSKGTVANNNNASNGNTETASKGTVANNNNVSNGNTETSSKDTTTNNNTTSESVDNGVLEKATSENISVPENMKLLSTNNAKEENNSENIKAMAVLYELDGNVVNWFTDNDLIYVITSGNNRLVVINSKTMMAVANVPLAGKPAEINLVGQEIYISLPDLYRIDIFSKSNYVKKSSLSFAHEVSSFCVDGNYIYYSEHDQHCDVYKKNMTTNELTQILPDKGWSFYQPKLYLNKQDNILYIGESGITGSTLYYYDATTLQLKSLFRKNDYGITNHTRDIFHMGNEILWGNYRFSDTDANQIIGRYGEKDYGSINFASKDLVSTFEGIFLADTYECIVNYFDAGFDYEFILVTQSYNVFFRARSIDKNIIIGVNFSM